MILKFIDENTRKVNILDNVSDIIYYNKREQAYLEGVNNALKYVQDVDICNLSEIDIQNFSEEETGEKYITFWRISYTDSITNKRVSIVFNCSCFICNDQGITFDIIGVFPVL